MIPLQNIQLYLHLNMVKKVPKNFQEKVHFQEMIQDTLDDSTHLIVSSKKAKHPAVLAHKYEKPVALHSDSNEEFQKRHTYFHGKCNQEQQDAQKTSEDQAFFLCIGQIYIT